MRRFFTIFALLAMFCFCECEENGADNIAQPSNLIYYTTTDDTALVLLEDYYDFGEAVIVSNTYENGVGVLEFDKAVTTIGKYALGCCANLESISIPNSVTSIGELAFYGCSNLTDISIPNSVTSIGMHAFLDCSTLTTITIPDSVTEIKEFAFFGCSSLTTVTIPDSVTEISGAFVGCPNLTEFNGKLASIDGKCLIIDGTICAFASAGLTEYTIPHGVTSIGKFAFANCFDIRDFTIPNSVTFIESDAFRSCSSLESVIIPEGVTSIGESVFSDCSSLVNIILPNSLSQIETWAFLRCTSLASITIPDNVILIESWAFEGCSSLTEVYCQPATPPIAEVTINHDWGAFSGSSETCTIYVPTESVEAYKSAEHWSDYAAYIVGYDFE